MKNIFKLSMLVCFAVLAFTACKKLDPLPFYAAGKAPVILASVTSVTPAPADSNSQVLKIEWSDPEHATDPTKVKFLLQIDSAGKGFVKPHVVELIGRMDTTFIAKDFNNILIGLGFKFGVTYSVDVRVISSYANNNDRQISNTITLQVRPYVVPPKVQLPANGTLFLVGSATAGGWNNPVPVPAQKFTQIDTLTYEGTFYLIASGQYLILPENGSWDTKYAVANNTQPGLNAGGEFGYNSGVGPSIYNDNFPGPGNTGMYKIRLDLQNGKFTVSEVKLFSFLWVAGDYQGWNPASAPTLASPNADGVYEGYVNVPSGGSYEFKLTSQADWGGTNYGDGGPGALSTSGGNLIFPNGGGYYKINVNTNNSTWSIEPTTWGIVGSLTGWGGNPDIALNYDAGSGSFVSGPIVVGGNEEFKFRANSDWPINLGDSGADGSLEQDGANIPLTAGTYTITLYLNNSGYYTYKIVRN
ncbi:MAG TPA: SusE domain-containing protein [Ferruginibacter sp.]|nr:SusE domain-containing protein [Ferruginibacter sp.]HMP20671.1 SusE domain-containing protein [Ferruginibacter sp.]